MRTIAGNGEVMVMRSSRRNNNNSRVRQATRNSRITPGFVRLFDLFGTIPVGNVGKRWTRISDPEAVENDFATLGEDMQVAFDMYRRNLVSGYQEISTQGASVHGEQATARRREPSRP
jgi:hypothetical protein